MVQKLSRAKKHLLKLIHKHYPNERHQKYSPAHKLNVIIYVLKTGIPWYKVTDLADESTYRLFYKWLISNNIFKKAFENLQTSILSDELFIDSTTIFNKSSRIWQR